jgi:hypothetical protein
MCHSYFKATNPSGSLWALSPRIAEATLGDVKVREQLRTRSELEVKERRLKEIKQQLRGLFLP